MITAANQREVSAGVNVQECRRMYRQIVHDLVENLREPEKWLR
jgi:hypothetical protein